jgi:hypothetical protein
VNKIIHEKLIFSQRPNKCTAFHRTHYYFAIYRLDVRTGTTGLRRIIQYSHHPEIPSEDSPTNSQCPMVCNKSYLTQRFTYPTSPNCPTGTNRNLSLSTAISPKLAHGTNTHSARQQAIAKKMDTWRDHLRQRRWTSLWLPPTRINTLAYRDN